MPPLAGHDFVNSTLRTTEDKTKAMQQNMSYIILSSTSAPSLSERHSAAMSAL